MGSSLGEPYMPPCSWRALWRAHTMSFFSQGNWLFRLIELRELPIPLFLPEILPTQFQEHCLGAGGGSRNLWKHPGWIKEQWEVLYKLISQLRPLGCFQKSNNSTIDSAVIFFFFIPRKIIIKFCFFFFFLPKLTRSFDTGRSIHQKKGKVGSGKCKTQEEKSKGTTRRSPALTGRCEYWLQRAWMGCGREEVSRQLRWKDTLEFVSARILPSTSPISSGIKSRLLSPAVTSLWSSPELHFQPLLPLLSIPCTQPSRTDPLTLTRKACWLPATSWTGLLASPRRPTSSCIYPSRQTMLPRTSFISLV